MQISVVFPGFLVYVSPCIKSDIQINLFLLKAFNLGI